MVAETVPNKVGWPTYSWMPGIHIEKDMNYSVKIDTNFHWNCLIYTTELQNWVTRVLFHREIYKIAELLLFPEDGHLSTLKDSKTGEWIIFYPNHESFRYYYWGETSNKILNWYFYRTIGPVPLPDKSRILSPP